MICIEGAAARIYAWSDWSEIASVTISIDTKGLQLKSVTPYMSGHKQRILLELSELDDSVNTRSLYLLDADSFSTEIDTVKDGVAEVANTKKDSDEILSPFLGPQFAALAYDNGRLIFLDTHSWVCSADLKDLGNSSVLYIRHFFVPYDWFSGIRDVICVVTKRDVLFTRNDDIAIIKGGLEYVEKVQAKLEVVETKGNMVFLAAGG